jgi:hypothetical protein
MQTRALAGRLRLIPRLLGEIDLPLWWPAGRGWTSSHDPRPRAPLPARVPLW